MPLEKAIKSIPLIEGPDTKTDPKLSARPERLVNAVFRRGTLSKRAGRKSLPDDIAGGGTQSAGEALFAYGDELVRINGGTTYGLADALDQWVSKSGGNNYASLTVALIVQNTNTATDYDYAEANGVGVLVYANLSPNNHVAVVFDVQTGTIYQQAIISGANNNEQAVRCVLVGSTVVVLTGDFSGGNIRTSTISTTSPSTAPTAWSTIKTDLWTSARSFDAVAYNSSYAVVVYPNTGGTAGRDLGVFAVNASGAVAASPAGVTLSTVTAGASGLNRGILVQRDSAGLVYIVFGDSSVANGSTKFTILTSAFATSVAPTAIVSGNNWSGQNSDFAMGASCEITSGQITLVMEPYATLNTSVTYKSWLATCTLNSGGILTAFAQMTGSQGLSIVGDLSPYDGTYVFAAVNTTYSPNSSTHFFIGIQTTAFLITVGGKLVGRTLDSQAALAISATAPRFRVARSVQRNSSAVYTITQQGRFSSIATPLGLAQVTVTPALSTPIAVGETAYIPGALPRIYDGLNVAEAGISLYPEYISNSTAGAGGALSDGTYGYAFCWSWLANDGELVRGPVSPAVSITLSGGTATQAVTLNLASLPMSMRDIQLTGANVVLETYRTVANGTAYYRIGTPYFPDLNQSAPGGSNMVVVQDTGTSDAVLIANELIYTTGGILDWDAPPAHVLACAHQDRIVIVPSANPFSFMPSSEWAPGEQVRFSVDNIGLIPSDAGPIVGIGSLDGKLILLTTGGAYMTYGDGPDLLGNNPYPPVQRIVGVDSGPIPGTPTLTVPDGVIYQSSQGITLLDRALNQQFIGADVVKYSTGLWTVRDIALDSERQEIRILADMGSDVAGTLLPTGTTSLGGVALVYNYYYKQWSVFEDYGGQDACFYQGNYTMVRSDGVVWQEQPGTFRDDGDYVTSLIELPWLKMAGLQGFQRVGYVEFLGTYGSDFTAQIRVAYDYAGDDDGPDWSETVTLDGTGVYGLKGPLQLRHHLGHKCTAIKLEISDINLAGSGEGMSLTDMSVEYGVKKGVTRQPATKTA